MACEKDFELHEKILVGYSINQMYNLVSDINSFCKFLPYCLKSEVYNQKKNRIEAGLEIGYSPIIQKLKSDVTFEEPHQIKIESYNENIKFLKTTWGFSPGLENTPDSCVVDFNVAFEFKVEFYSKLMCNFFGILSNKMKSSFLQEANRRYGSPCIETVDYNTPTNEKIRD